jgi:ribonuclease HI
VFVKVTRAGEPAGGPDGRVDVLYRPGGKVYRAALRNLAPDPSPVTLADADAAPAAPAPSAPAPTGARPAGHAARATLGTPLIVYTDGACTGNPGPMGVGAVILDGKERKELSEFLGTGTNNIAELTAIERALVLCPRDRTVILHSDSSYALGLLGKAWKAKANQELVARLRGLAGEFADLRLVKVEGHAGVPENERCDELARAAILRGR